MKSLFMPLAPLRNAAVRSSLLAGLTLLAACSSDAPSQSDTLPQEAWAQYRAAFMSSEGRVIDTGNGDISHSEGQGYGMLLALAANDKDTFEHLWEWTREHLQREDQLFGWRWEPAPEHAVTDWNNASDGDLLIAWALAEAGSRWERDDWIDIARDIAQELRDTLIHDSDIGALLMPAQSGFQHDDYIELNPSYWVFPAFRALDRIDPDPVWQSLSSSGKRLIALARFGPAGVPPDWLHLHEDGYLSLPGEPERRRLGFEAPRVPLYLCWDGQRDAQLLDSFLRAWPDDQSPAWIDLGNGDRAAYSLSLTQRAMRQLVLACDGQQEQVPIEIVPEDYYGSSLSLLSYAAMASGSEAR